MEDATAMEYNEASLLDSEFPPENMHLVEDLKTGASLEEMNTSLDLDKPLGKSAASKVSILEKLNNKTQSTIQIGNAVGKSRKSITTSIPIEIDQNETLIIKSAVDIGGENDSNLQFEELVKLHRQHLRDSTDSGKNESKLLVNFTMKRSTSDRVNVTTDVYLKELDSFMDRKLAGIQEIKRKISEIRSFLK